MINATMTIKGDPYWLETFVPVEVEKGNFGKEIQIILKCIAQH